jgi:hypothetical protein
MSNYYSMAKHPDTGIEEMAEFLDDYYGKHNYGVRFSDGKVFPEIQCQLNAVTQAKSKPR